MSYFNIAAALLTLASVGVFIHIASYRAGSKYGFKLASQMADEWMKANPAPRKCISCATSNQDTRDDTF